VAVLLRIHAADFYKAFAVRQQMRRRAQTGTITQLYTFPCPNTVSGVCHGGYRPDVPIQASDGNFYGAAQLTTFGSSNPQGALYSSSHPAGNSPGSSPLRRTPTGNT